MTLTIYDEACAIWNMAWKVSLTSFSRVSLISISLMFLGHLGRAELAAAAMASIWISGSQVFIFGFAISLCTLCGQAYGAKNYELVGIWLQLGLFFITLFAIPIIVSFFYVNSLLCYLTSDEEVLALADTFARYSTLSVWPQCIYSAVRQYLQSQEIVNPATIVATSTVIISIFANYLLIYGLGFGFIGAPLAHVVESFYQLGAILFACWYKGYHKKTWFGFTWECFRMNRMRSFLRVTIGMTIYIACDEWVYSILAAIAGLLGTNEIAANSVLFNLAGVVFAIFFGFALPTQVRCANYLGANQPDLAKRIMKVGFCLGSVAAFAIVSFIYIFSHTISGFFSTDESIISILVNTIPVFCLALFAFALHFMLAAVVEAMSLTSVLIGVVGTCAWGIILPCAYFFAITMKEGIDGIWWGSFTGESVKFVVMSIVLCYIDWQRMATDAVKRSEGKLDENEITEDIINRASAAADSVSPMFPLSPMTNLSVSDIAHENHLLQDETQRLVNRHSFDERRYGTV